jgi:hypothetical protein
MTTGDRAIADPAEAGHPVGMAEVLAGARREYRKMGRLLPGEWT